MVYHLLANQRNKAISPLTSSIRWMFKGVAFQCTIETPVWFIIFWLIKETKQYPHLLVLYGGCSKVLPSSVQLRLQYGLSSSG